MKSFLKNTKIFLAVTILVISYFGIFSNPQKVSADVCNVTSANFRTSPGAQYPTNNFTAPGNYPYVYVDVQTTGCVGSTIYVSLNYFSPSIFGAGSWYSVDNANHIPVSITAGLESFTLEFVAGQQGCISDVNDWDCRYRIATWTMLGLDNTDTSVAGGHSWNDVYNPGNNMVANMMLEYDCHESLVVGTACSQSPAWQHISQIFPFGTISSFDSYTSTGVNTLSPGAIDDSYLAPLPGITVGSASTLGGYLRALFSVLIVIAGILAFIMVVIGAVTYLSSDAFSGKSEGKEMILNAVFGLILALGAWIILNTINPNLASNLEITIPDVSFNPTYENEDSVGAGTDSITLNLQGGGTTVVNNCDTTKMVTVTAFGGHTFQIYQGLVSSIQAIDAAWQAMPADQRYIVNSIGGYNCRKVAGTQSWSAHAFGVAVDINPSKNPFGITLITDMPPSFRQLWTSHGWGWGGSWNSKKDAMHFSKHPISEGGDNMVTN
jgi:hypothetical protein